MTSPADSLQTEVCERLATWLATEASAGNESLPAFPADLESHVSECLSCYRFASEWRELPRREGELRALMNEAEIDSELGMWNDAFWRQLPARVYREVQEGREQAPEKGTPAAAGVALEERKPLRSRVLRWSALTSSVVGAAAAAVVLLAWQGRHPAPSSHAVVAGAIVASPPSPSRQAPRTTLVSEPASAEEASWVGALAELDPKELAALLEKDELTSLKTSPWQDVQELEDLQETWGARAEGWDEAFVSSGTSR